MYPLLWLVPAIPLAGFTALALLGNLRLPRRLTSIIGVGSVGLSALLTALIGVQYLASAPTGSAYTQTVWNWMSTGGLTLAVSFRLDALSLTMIFVVTFVGFLIHLYSAEHMGRDEGYNRFFACMNLFVAAMLVLVLADNLVLLYLGWEGVGLCSYLLIGFWYREEANGRAARKAFLVTRVGDAALAVGMFLIFVQLGTWNIQDLMQRAAAQWTAGSAAALLAAVLLLAGALGKSAKLPLQVWLPDAMAGPTPVSALIHAATMVTAGVYLIARTNVLFSLAPAVMLATAVIGAATLLLAGLSALVQRDIKRVLAYSTMSQVGYMFLALGAGAWSAAIFHFWTHAFFKALLFLGAGVVIASLDEEHDIFRMGGLRKTQPLTFWTFLIGACSLSALPLLTAGFYSKDKILWDVWSSPRGGAVLWAAGLAGAFLTSIYIFRVVFKVFFGAPSAKVQESSTQNQPGLRVRIPLLVLAVFSIGAGFVELPEALGNIPAFSNFLSGTLPALALRGAAPGSEIFLEIDAAAAALFGLLLAYVFFLRRPDWSAKLARSPAGRVLGRFWFSGWGFDWLYETVIVHPYVRLAAINKDDVFDWLIDRLITRPYAALARISRGDFFDRIFSGIAGLNAGIARALSALQNGYVRWYAAGIVAGAIILIAMAVLQ
ncbi:MAG: NADH-quinone oxidoreductase subunit L [Anaerolineales bacterium]